MSKEPKDYLRHIQDECIFIISVSENLIYEDLSQQLSFDNQFYGFWNNQK